MSIPVPDSSPVTVVHADRAAALPLRVSYERASASEVLTDPHVLAVLGFGYATDRNGAISMASSVQDDPRFLRVGLQSPGDNGVIEVWRGNSPVTTGRDGRLRWSSNGEYLWFAIEIDERDLSTMTRAHSLQTDIEMSAESAYREIVAFHGGRPNLHPLRFWNYFDAINAGDGDAERYRHFCTGRASGLGDVLGSTYPAATAIGRQDGVRVLQIYGISAIRPGMAIENPRQVSAWRYPRAYGPTSPSFARAMRSDAKQLFISGTAAVVGHASRHDNDLDAQIAETLANLDSVLNASGSGKQLGTLSLLKAYVRFPADAARVESAVRERFPDLRDLLILGGDICRRELLVEIDGVHG
ncbi:MAG: pteridine-dependent deoxygenase [Dokdonella sp.]